jgi:hypothetical protein
MKQIIYFFCITFIICVFTGCYTDISKDTIKESQEKKCGFFSPCISSEYSDIQYIEFTAKSNYNDEKIGCDAYINYPQLFGDNKENVNKINKKIEEAVTNLFLYYLKGEHNIFDQEIFAASPSEAIELFVTEGNIQLEKFLLEFGKNRKGYAQRLISEITLYQDNILSIRFDLYNEFGGAHPMYRSSVITFDMNTGDVLDVEDIISPNNLEGFYRYEKEILIQANPNRFSHIEKVLHNNNFPEEFHVKEIYLTPDGMKSLYQDYEITSHGEGIPKNIIPYKNLVEFLNSNSPVFSLL